MRPAFSIASMHAQVVAGKRHVDDHQGVLHGAADHLGVVDHFVERDRQRVGVALHDHRHAVADENALDAGRVEQRGHRVVVGREHRDLLAGGLHGRKSRNRHSLRVWLHVLPDSKASSIDRTNSYRAVLTWQMVRSFSLLGFQPKIANFRSPPASNSVSDIFLRLSLMPIVRSVFAPAKSRSPPPLADSTTKEGAYSAPKYFAHSATKHENFLICRL